jgi:hypothetical protein
MPVQVEIDNDNKEPNIQIPVQSANTPTKGNPTTATAHSTTILAATAAIPATGFHPKEFYAQLIETMKNFQAPQQPSKIVVESWDHEETVDLAKLQTSMLQLMYAHGKISWDDNTINNICAATFSAGFKNLQGRLDMVQSTQLSNLFMTVFTTKPEDDDHDNPFNPLNSLMSLIIFPMKCTKGHLNASLQSNNIETSLIYKSTLFHPFHYTPQTNYLLVTAAAKEMDKERNKINWRMVEKDRKHISLIIEGVGRINSMEDIAMTCANICGMEVAIVNVASAKSILYQFAIRLIKSIENKKQKPGCAIILILLRTHQWFSLQNCTSFFSTLLSSPRI